MHGHRGRGGHFLGLDLPPGVLFCSFIPSSPFYRLRNSKLEPKKEKYVPQELERVSQPTVVSFMLVTDRSATSHVLTDETIGGWQLTSKYINKLTQSV